MTGLLWAVVSSFVTTAIINSWSDFCWLLTILISTITSLDFIIYTLAIVLIIVLVQHYKIISKQTQLIIKILSPLTFLVSVRITIFFLCVCLLLGKFYPLQYIDLVGVHQIIAALIFALFIFVAEGLRENKTRIGLQVYLSNNYIVFLVFFELIFVFVTLCAPHVHTLLQKFNYVELDPILKYTYNWFNFLSSVGIVFLIGLSVYDAFDFVIHKEKFISAFNELFKSNLRENLTAQLNFRRKDNEFYNLLRESGFNISFFAKAKGKVAVYPEKSGSISGVNINDFIVLLNELEIEARTKSFTFKNNDIDVTGDANVDGTEVVREKKLTQRSLYIPFSIGDDVKKSFTPLLLFSDDVGVSKEYLEDFRKRLRKTIQIEQDWSKSLLHINYDDLSRVFIDAIRNKDEGEVIRLKNLYIDFAVSILEFFQKNNISYTYTESSREFNSSFWGNKKWLELDFLLTDMKRLLRESLLTERQEIISAILSLHAGIIHYAIQYRNNLVLYYFKNFFELQYLYTKDDEFVLSEKVVSQIRNNNWIVLTEVIQHYVEYSFENELITKQKLEEYKGIATQVESIFLQLLKSTVDNNDLKSFSLYLENLSQLFVGFQDHPTRRLKYKMAGSRRSHFSGFVSRQQNIILFGFASWLIKSRSHLVDYITEIFKYLPQDFKELTETFIQATNHDVSERWGWEWWDVKASYGRPRMGEFIGLGDAYAITYVIKSLEVIGSYRGGLPTNIPKVSRDFIFNVDSDIKRVIDSINNDDKKLEYLASLINRENIERLNAALLTLKDIQQKEENIDIIGRKIPSEKLLAFKEEFIQTLKSTVNFKDILKKYIKTERYNTRPDEYKDVPLFGFNRIINKDAFFDNWYIHYGNLGKDFAESIKNGEDRELIKKIKAKSVKRSFKSFKRFVEEHDMSEYYVFVDRIGVWDYEQNVESSRFSVDYQNNTVKVKDSRGNLIEINGIDRIIKGFLVISKTKFGKLVQLAPVSKGELIQDDFAFEVSIFSDNEKLVSEYIQNPPEWLAAIPANGREEYLKLHAVVRIQESFTLEFDKNFEGYFFRDITHFPKRIISKKSSET